MESIKLTEIIETTPIKVYNGFIDSHTHSEMTGALADVTPERKGSFFSLKGYITGSVTELMPYRQLFFKIRTKDFPADAPDSVLELTFERNEAGTKVILKQSKIPDGMKEKCLEMWSKKYFEPMKKYFKKKANR